MVILRLVCDRKGMEPRGTGKDSHCAVFLAVYPLSPSINKGEPCTSRGWRLQHSCCYTAKAVQSHSILTPFLQSVLKDVFLCEFLKERLHLDFHTLTNGSRLRRLAVLCSWPSISSSFSQHLDCLLPHPPRASMSRQTSVPPSGPRWWDGAFTLA